MQTRTNMNAAKKLKSKRYKDTRPSPSKRGYGGRWRHLRRIHLSGNPLCDACTRLGITALATDVDHIIPHKGDEQLKYDADNLQSLCHSCHSIKTAKEDGGFGRDIVTSVWGTSKVL